jgi:hypothetical protein
LRVSRLLRWLARKAHEKGEQWLTTTATVQDFPVVVTNTRSEIETPALIDKLDAALRLIAVQQPRRFRKLRRDVARFVVRRYPCRGAYFHDGRICLVELTFLGNPDFQPSQIAATILHEATHARLARAGLPTSGPTAERMCRKAELDFGRSLPDGAAVIARAEESLAMTDEDVAPVIDWALARRRVAAMDIKALPIPKWMRRHIAKRKGLRLADVGLEEDQE